MGKYIVNYIFDNELEIRRVVESDSEHTAMIKAYNDPNMFLEFKDINNNLVRFNFNGVKVIKVKSYIEPEIKTVRKRD